MEFIGNKALNPVKKKKKKVNCIWGMGFKHFGYLGFIILHEEALYILLRTWSQLNCIEECR